MYVTVGAPPKASGKIEAIIAGAHAQLSTNLIFLLNKCRSFEEFKKAMKLYIYRPNKFTRVITSKSIHFRGNGLFMQMHFHNFVGCVNKSTHAH